MKALVLTAALAMAVSAQAEGWKGIGEFGLAITGGNTDTTNINGKLGLVKESDAWKHEFGIGILKASAKQNVITNIGPTGLPVIENRTVDTANRYDAAWTSGYKLSETSYIFGSLRYENDDFLSFESQAVAALGYGFYPIKDETTSLLFEVGAGYRRINLRPTGDEGDAIFRGKMDFSRKLTENTAIYDTFLAEIGSDNKFYVNDLGLAVKMSDAFAIKTGIQFRHNSDVAPGIKKTDRLFTTNLVYSF
jgi:putative salt-induced outer membrane protein